MSESERIVRLEERFTHLHQHVIEQDKVMLELNSMVVRLQRELGALRDRIETTLPRGRDVPPDDERPPHY